VLVEITGHQFAWDMRYPGKDGVLGKKVISCTISHWETHLVLILKTRRVGMICIPQ